MSNLPPSPREIATSLITSLRTDPQTAPEPNKPLQHPSQDIKNIFLTLHVLFTNELLPALDLLDRGLVSRLYMLDGPVKGSEGAREPEQASSRRRKGYFVRSAQQNSSSSSSSSSSRFRNALSATSTIYAVQLQSWSCSCPAFAFAAFPASAAQPTARVSSPSPWEEHDSLLREEWRVGGLSLGDDMPVCKHLLACALAEYAPMFATAADERIVDVDEWAGWAAGWGD